MISDKYYICSYDKYYYMIYDFPINDKILNDVILYNIDS